MYTISEMTELWQKALKLIEKKINDKKTFDSFFDQTYVDNIVGNTISLVATSQLASKIIVSNYQKIVCNILRDLTGEDFTIKVICNPKGKKITTISEKGEPQKTVEYFKDCKVNKDNNFDNFIVGNFNKSAFRAAKIVSEFPGKKYNPLFIHSNSGLGKTHLLHSIGNYICEHTPDKANVLYIPSTVFVDEYIKYVTGDKSLQNLTDFFKNTDVLLFDDVQFLKEKVKTQEMFFNIYERMVNMGKQIVIASDRHPNELKGLEDRLVSRFQQGLVIDIKEPDMDSCVEIFKAKVRENGVDINRISDDVINFYAEKYSKNIRELDGAINRLIFDIENLDENEEINISTALKFTHSYSSSKQIATQLTEAKIINEVASYYQIPAVQISGESREANIVKARHVAIYLIYNLMKDVSLKRIGSMFNGKDHSTIKYSVDKIDKELKTNDQLRNSVEKLKAQLNGK